jgi:hypothetical protein
VHRFLQLPQHRQSYLPAGHGTLPGKKIKLRLAHVSFSCAFLFLICSEGSFTLPNSSNKLTLENRLQNYCFIPVPVIISFA